MKTRAETGSRAARPAGLARWLSLLALGFSSMAAVDEYGGAHAFCAPGSGCDAVRHSAIGGAIALGVPALGVLGWSAAVLWSLAGAALLRRLALAASATGGVIGLILLLLQAFAIRAFCSVCSAADLLALAAGLCGFAALRARAEPPPPSPRARSIALSAWVLALGAPIAFAIARPRPLPGYVRALARRGALNVIELSDFECPFCRAMHPVLKAALQPYHDRVHLARISYPLPGHPQARDAARAYLCADAQGQGEAMADFLFAADDMSPRSTTARAAGAGLDPARFSACMRDPATDARIKADMARVDREGFRGLPLVFIGEQSLLGFDAKRGQARYDDALAAAAGGRPPPNGPLALALLALCAAAPFALGWRQR